MSDEIHIQFTRFSAFYSPLIATLAGGFLREEGFTARHSTAPPGQSAIEGVKRPLPRTALSQGTLAHSRAVGRAGLEHDD